MDFSLTGKFAAMHPAYPLIDSNLHGKDNHKGGAQRHYRSQHSRNLVSQVEEEDTSHCEEKVVVKIEAPELPPIDLKKGRFPYCLVWVPLPVVAWLVPFVGHVGICREDGVIIDFAGRINIDNLAFGSAAKYVPLRLDQCCFSQQPLDHVCKEGSSHLAGGSAISWDNAVNQTMLEFGKKSYNFFTCNCHSFVANCMNRMAYKGSTRWNLVEVLVLVLVRGTFVNFTGFLRAYVPFVAVMSLGFWMAGWVFFFFWCGFTSLLLGWFTFGTYAFGGIIDC